MPAITGAEIRITQFKTARTTTTAITVWQVALGTLFHSFGAFLTTSRATSTAGTYRKSRCNYGITAGAANQCDFSHRAPLLAAIEACSYEILYETDDDTIIKADSGRQPVPSPVLLSVLCQFDAGIW